MSRKRGHAVILCLILVASAAAVSTVQGIPQSHVVDAPTVSLSSALDAPQQQWPPTMPPSPSAVMEKKALSIPSAAKATWLYYPAAGVSTKLDSYTSQDGILDPPGTRADSERIFALEPYSSQAGAGGTNTFYVIGHGYDDGTGVMNRIMARAKAGQLFTVTTQKGKVCYRVNRITKEKKQDISNATADASVRRPGWMVFITCYAAPGNPKTVWGPDSAVLYAQMQPCAL